MKLIVVNKQSGKEIFTESSWEGPVPRAGEVMEIHSGAEQRFVVEEVDWIFEDAPKDTHDEVPLKCAKVLVSIEIAEGDGKSTMGQATGSEWCTCGHKSALHADHGCKGGGGYCPCTHFTPNLST